MTSSHFRSIALGKDTSKASRNDGAIPAGKYREIIKRAESKLGLKVLTPEYEVASFFFDAHRITPLEMQGQFSGSSASLFKILKALEARGVLRTEVNSSDRRSKFYCLSDKALGALHKQWGQYKEHGAVTAYAPDDNSDLMHHYTKTISENLKVKQFTCDFQILVYIYSSPGLASVRFHDLVDVSQAKFNTSLLCLKNMGLIYHALSPADRRRKLYYLSDQSIEILDEMTRGIFLWLDSQPEFLTALQPKAL
ncbi:hypothetical protein [Novosphingobium mangrovi (ex Huang et al. 2023)]|uniref:HTH marR-type domain-containing protein n=1 Tax=Novosphingobium mangrovi (ex Huang et al. 2023) TaxID=2976432 RepID=A0ABT2I772_9SPHN|nr:hypothetical protein [Novosphingobium mangrovi (ex Huang et al. 2023)]MCT2400667.1 hypothetical protein [Novosphingobium mangrovi (ex Huang et al. 2023)]